MANTTSGTVTFDKTFAVDEIIEEAYERIGLQSVSGYQLKTARRSLNILFQEWGNRGLHYWEVGDTNVDLIEGLSPAISIEQKTNSHNPRSTVGTVTEIYDYLRVLFARVGIPYSPTTGLPIKSQSVSEITDLIIANNKNVMSVSLGNRVLRSDTAITVALFCIQEFLSK